jgi:hypothetical protein
LAIQVLQTPLFAKQKKKLRKTQIKELDKVYCTPLSKQVSKKKEI